MGLVRPIIVICLEDTVKPSLAISHERRSMGLPVLPNIPHTIEQAFVTIKPFPGVSEVFEFLVEFFFHLAGTFNVKQKV